MEERVKTLEEKVATLEALLENSGGTAKTDSTQATQTSAAPVFYDGFEKGITKWTEEIRFISPHDSKSALKISQIASHDPCRVTKTLRTKDGIIDAFKGKRFFTAAAADDGLSKMQSKIEKSSGWVQTWRGVRHLVQKDGFSIKDMDLPVVRFHALLPTSDTSRQSSVEKIPRGLFQVGYITEKETVDHFHPLMKTPKPTKGWEEFEVELSSAPKDKKIHLVFRYIGTDARHHPNAGMQLDEITIFDDK